MVNFRKIGRVHYYIDSSSKQVQGFLRTRNSIFSKIVKIPFLKNYERLVLRDVAHGIGEGYFKEKTISATASCSDLDDYSEEIGKDIVNLKLSYRWNMVMATRLDKIAFRLLELSKKVLRAASKYNDDAMDDIAALAKYEGDFWEEEGRV